MSRIKFCGSFVFVVAMIVLGAQLVAAQATTGSVYGRILDPSKAVIAEARVTALNQATGVRYPGKSDDQGN